MELDSLLTLIAKSYNGDPWHGPSVEAVLAGVDAKTACARPDSGGHSIWELVLHLNAWVQEVERRLKGSAPGEPREGDWPETADGSEVEWARALSRLRESQNSLLETIGAFPVSRWNEKVGTSSGSLVTYLEMMLGVMQHYAYHSGQMSLLKKLVTKQ